MANDLTFEILALAASDDSSLYMLVHVAEEPDDWETYRSAVVRKTADSLDVVHRIGTWVQAMWRSPSGALYLASTEGAVLSDASGRWETTPLSRHGFDGIWGFDDDTIFCCGSSGTLFRKSGSRWIPFNEGVSGNLLTVRGLAPDDLYAVAENGFIFHYDGRSWSSVESPTNQMLVDVLPLARDEVYFCGWKGSFFVKRGLTWDTLVSPDINLYSQARHDGSILVAAAGKGVFRFDGTQLVPFKPGIPASGLVVADSRLLVFGGTVIHELQGGNWSRHDLDFSALGL